MGAAHCPLDCWLSILLLAIGVTLTDVCVWAQDNLSPKMPRWYIDYFELKLLKKWPMQEGCSDLLFVSPKAGKTPLMGKVYTLHLEGDVHV